MKKQGVARIALLGVMIGMSIMYGFLKRVLKPRIHIKNDQLRKDKEFYEVLVEWLNVRQNDKNLIDFFVKRRYTSVAVYGMKELGELLCSELSGSGIDIKYVIDRNADAIWTDATVFRPDDDLPEVDVIVVTAITSFETIKEYLERKVKCPIVSLEDVVFD